MWNRLRKTSYQGHSLTGAYAELEFDIEFDYSPGSPAVLYPNDRAHPGDASELTITSVKLGDIELVDRLTDKQLECLEEQAIEHVTAMSEEW